MLHSRYIVVQDFPDGKTEVLYCGPDSIAAQKEMAKCIESGQADAVLLFAHPTFNQVRYPALEKLEAQNRAAENERLKNADVIAKRNQAEANRKKAKELSAEAKRLEAQADAHDSLAAPGGGPPSDDSKKDKEK